MTFVLAHLSDLHLPPDDAPTIRQLLGKRLLSYLAWRRKRPLRDHDLSPSLLLAEMAEFAPDAIALSGDLTNFALPCEFRAAARFLERLGPPGRVLVISGNHDTLVRVPPAEGLGHWAPWMRGDDGATGFPYVQRKGCVALIGLSTAIVTAPGFAAGCLGAAQLARLGPLLASLREEGLFRLILIHHPPTGESQRRGLRDRAALLALLAREGAEMLLHGHSHRGLLVPLPGPGGRMIPSIGVPPALAGNRRHYGSRWHRYTISAMAGGWSVETLVRGLDEAGTGFATLGQWRVEVEAEQNFWPLEAVSG